MHNHLTTREAIAILRDYAPILNDCPRLRDAILLVAAVAEHNHSRRTRKKKQRMQKAKEMNGVSQ